MNETARMLAKAGTMPDGYIAGQTHINGSAQALASDLIAAHDEAETDFDIAAQGAPDAAMTTLLQKLDDVGGHYEASKDALDALKRLIRDEGMDFARQTRATPFYARLAIIDKSPDDLPPCKHYHYIIIDADTAKRRNTQFDSAPHFTIFGTQSSQSRLPHIGPIAAHSGKKALIVYFASMSAEDETQPVLADTDSAQDTLTHDDGITSPEITEQRHEAVHNAQLDDEPVPAWTDADPQADKAPDDIPEHAAIGAEQDTETTPTSSRLVQDSGHEGITDTATQGNQPLFHNHSIAEETPATGYAPEQARPTVKHDDAPYQSHVGKSVDHINAGPAEPARHKNASSHSAIKTQARMRASAPPEQAQSTRHRNAGHAGTTPQPQQTSQGAVSQTHRNHASTAAAKAVHVQTPLQAAFHQHGNAAEQQPQPAPSAAGHIPANDTPVNNNPANHVTPGQADNEPVAPIMGQSGPTILQMPDAPASGIEKPAVDTPDSGSVPVTTETAINTGHNKTSYHAGQDTGQRTGQKTEPSPPEQPEAPASSPKPESPQSPEEGLRSHPPGCGCQLCSGDKSGEEAEQAPDADALFGPGPDTQPYTPMTKETDAGGSAPEEEIAKHPPGCGCKICSGESSGEKAVQSADPFASDAPSGPDNDKNRGRQPAPV